MKVFPVSYDLVYGLLPFRERPVGPDKGLSHVVIEHFDTHRETLGRRLYVLPAGEKHQIESMIPWDSDSTEGRRRERKRSEYLSGWFEEDMSKGWRGRGSRGRLFLKGRKWVSKLS